jgi:hypothetical protein
LFSVQSKLPVSAAAIIAMTAYCAGTRAQDDVRARDKSRPAQARSATDAAAKTSQRTATIHWQRVPLRDALERLHSLFSDSIFVDRRIDPSMRVSLDIEVASAEEAVAAIAARHELGVARLGKLVYLGPNSAADQLRTISAARSQEAARLPAALRTPLTRKQPTTWPRLSEPRRLIASIVEDRGWKLANFDVIPHDLWSAGELPELTLAEQLTVLLVGFDLSFELRSNDRSVEVVPLKTSRKPAGGIAATKPSPAPAKSAGSKKEAKHVYTLRVQEKPVRAVLQELSKRLHWAIEIDEESIKTAGKSLDKRVSFSVENADREKLLEALLRPAGLDYQLDVERVRIIAGRDDEK